MGKVDRLPNRVEPFAALFKALGGIVPVQLTLPAGPASLLRQTHRACPCMIIVGQFLTKTR